MVNTIFVLILHGIQNVFGITDVVILLQPTLELDKRKLLSDLGDDLKAFLATT